jgi:hypothetical protein
MNTEQVRAPDRRNCRLRVTLVFGVIQAPGCNRIIGGVESKEGQVTNPVDALILDLLEWIGEGSRPYTEVIEAWRTSCPRLPVWEDANDQGFIEHTFSPMNGKAVSVSPLGLKHLQAARRLKERAAPTERTTLTDESSTKIQQSSGALETAAPK